MSTRPLTRTTLGPCFSEGSRLLWQALKARGLNQVQAEHLLGVSSGLVNRWLYGDRRPSLKLTLKMQELFGIEPAAWHQEPAEAFEPPALTG